jgi:hypothetical protein
MNISELREGYHKQICENIIRMTKAKNGIEYPNFCDVASKASVNIGLGITDKIKYANKYDHIKEQTVGDLFETATKIFLEQSFAMLHTLRPGNWIYSTGKTDISGFDQYEHLANLSKVIKKDKTLAAVMGGDYIVKPDIIVARIPVPITEINLKEKILNSKQFAKFTPLLESNHSPSVPILHASISCKWTIRSDRSQNTRTEALNLIRNRKGNLPHIVAVTAEPLPTRIAALALGTGDLDCVYHFALNELIVTVNKLNNEDQLDILHTMLQGRRLRDITDLPFDLAV